jgi:hypothetical protein
MHPWTPQYDGLQRYKVTPAGTEKKRPANHENSQLAGLPQVVAGDGVRIIEG